MSGIKFVNFTGNPVSVAGTTYRPEGLVRVKVLGGYLESGMFRHASSEPVGLPEAETGTIIIVSKEVAVVCDRKDIAYIQSGEGGKEVLVFNRRYSTPDEERKLEEENKVIARWSLWILVILIVCIVVMALHSQGVI